MGLRRIKISELKLSETLKGLFTIGYKRDENGTTESVHVGLEFVSEAASAASSAAEAADESREKTERATAESIDVTIEAKGTIADLVIVKQETQEATQNANDAAQEARDFVNDANRVTVTESDKQNWNNKYTKLESDEKISLHNENGDAHPALRNSITNLENGATPAGRSEYAQKLGDTNGSYTKTQLDTCLSGLIRDVTYDSATAKFTFWFPDGRTIEIDTPLENTVKDGRYDTATASLVLVLVSGQEISIPAAGLTKIYTGKDTATATTTVNAAGEIAVALKQGTIDSVHLSSALQAAINSHLTLTGDTCNNIATFADQPTERPTRVNLASGDKHSLLFGKIKRWFSDLGALAFLNKVGKTDLDAALQGELNGKEPGFTKNSAFNKNFGTAAGTVCQGNDARLSDARTANGGNADTVDGKHATDFVQTNARNTINGSLTIKDSVYQPLLIYSHAQPNPASMFLGSYNDLVLRLHDNPGGSDTGTDVRINSDKFTWKGKQLATTDQLPASLPANGGTSEQTNAIVVQDTRASASTPSWLSRNVRFWFSCLGTPDTDWWSGLHINGWDSTYAAWELSAPSSSGKPDSRALYFRSGIGNTFNAWQRVAFYGDLPTSLPANGGNAHTVDGLHAAAAGVVEGGKLASYDINGYMNATIFRDAWQAEDNIPVGFVGIKISQADGYHRFCSLPRFRAVLGNMPPSAHTHPKSQITDFPTNIVTTDTTQTISGAKTFTAYCDFRGGGGNSGSDMRFKKEVAPVENILTALLNLDVIQYTWDKSGETRRATFGLSASQLLEKGGVFGKIVHERGDEDATQWVEYDRVGVLVLKGLQEIARRTEDENAILRQELNSLRQEMTALREHVQSLKNMILR